MFSLTLPTVYDRAIARNSKPRLKRVQRLYVSVVFSLLLQLPPCSLLPTFRDIMGSTLHIEPEASFVRRARPFSDHALPLCWEVTPLSPKYIGHGTSAAIPRALCTARIEDTFPAADAHICADNPGLPSQVKHDPEDLSIAHGLHTVPISQSICDFLDAHASAAPSSLSVQDILGGQLTYGTLHARSVHLARRLQEFGVSRGSRVCLVVERSSAFLIAIFAVLRLGAAYIPLDGALVPQGVLKGVVEDARPTLILVSKAHISRFGCVEGKWYCIEDLLHANGYEEFGLQASFNHARPEDPAYIIFTSGSVLLCEKH